MNKDEELRAGCRHEVFWKESYVDRGVEIRIEMRHPDGLNRAMALIVPDDALWEVGLGMQTPLFRMRPDVRQGQGPAQDGWDEVAECQKEIGVLENIIVKLDFGETLSDEEVEVVSRLNEEDKLRAAKKIEEEAK